MGKWNQCKPCSLHASGNSVTSLRIISSSDVEIIQSRAVIPSASGGRSSATVLRSTPSSASNRSMSDIPPNGSSPVSNDSEGGASTGGNCVISSSAVSAPTPLRIISSSEVEIIQSRAVMPSASSGRSSATVLRSTPSSASNCSISDSSADASSLVSGSGSFAAGFPDLMAFNQLGVFSSVSDDSDFEDVAIFIQSGVGPSTGSSIS